MSGKAADDGREQVSSTKGEEIMLKRVIVAAFLVAALAAPAAASQCQTDVAKIDAALAANSSLNAQIKSTVKTLRDTGARLCASGKEQEAAQTLNGAKQILKNVGVQVN